MKVLAQRAKRGAPSRCPLGSPAAGGPQWPARPAGRPAGAPPARWWGPGERAGTQLVLSCRSVALGPRGKAAWKWPLKQVLLKASWSWPVLPERPHIDPRLEGSAAAAAARQCYGHPLVSVTCKALTLALTTSTPASAATQPPVQGPPPAARAASAPPLPGPAPRGRLRDRSKKQARNKQLDRGRAASVASQESSDGTANCGNGVGWGGKGVHAERGRAKLPHRLPPLPRPAAAAPRPGSTACRPPAVTTARRGSWRRQ